MASTGPGPPGGGGGHEGGGYSGSSGLGDFQQLALLGEGAYSSVYKVRRLADGQTYALKKVKLPSLSDKEKRNALNEIRLLASVNHENVISYKEAFFDDGTKSLCIVTECADAGDLLQRVHRCQRERRHLIEQDLWRYLAGMARGLQALHELRILHRDMKSANVFLSTTKTGTTTAKLGDFNVSAVAKRGLCMTQTGTPYYASPEVWRDMPYDSKSDMWSLGCVMYEACALKPPFQAHDMEGLYRKVLRGQYPRIPHLFSQDLAEVVAALIQVNPRSRPTAAQVLEMPPVRDRVNGDLHSPRSEAGSELLNTIKVPQNILDLAAYLPRPRYGALVLQRQLHPLHEDMRLQGVSQAPLGASPPVSPPLSRRPGRQIRGRPGAASGRAGALPQLVRPVGQGATSVGTSHHSFVRLPRLAGRAG
eukprot:CAMPEP_0170245878 /NCGR_PEP_ID=MMETSP0116_2-20130129/22725_1 /TAXON_ID=400756 /ORGANISM="Durinskia baltica, Strain CSIRO CS-38" /LENGTH=420 /DNA_ID=CAMNT_0010496753 /DNA_START=49 /DNA_END=1311 /DNA_ORIENTATION=+